MRRTGNEAPCNRPESDARGADVRTPCIAQSRCFSSRSLVSTRALFGPVDGELTSVDVLAV